MTFGTARNSCLINENKISPTCTDEQLIVYFHDMTSMGSGFSLDLSYLQSLFAMWRKRSWIESSFFLQFLFSNSRRRCWGCSFDLRFFETHFPETNQYCKPFSLDYSPYDTLTDNSKMLPSFEQFSKYAWNHCGSSSTNRSICTTILIC